MFADHPSIYERAEHDRRFNIMFRTVVGMIAVSVFICFFIISVLIHKASQTDFSNGLKPVIEQLWCGEINCMEK